MKLIEINVDDNSAWVDADEFMADPNGVIEDIRAARAEVVGDLSDLYEPFPDYDTLDAIAAHQMGL